MKHLFFHIFLFSLFMPVLSDAQINVNNLYHKTWKTKSYGVKFLNQTYTIYHKDSVNNPLDYITKTFVFSDTGAYTGKDVKNDSIFRGKWKINSKGDSLTFDGRKKYLNLLDANNLITSIWKLQYADSSGKVDTIVYYLHLYSIPDITSIHPFPDDSPFVVFPNPASGSFRIRFASDMVSTDVSYIRLTNLLPQPVREQAVFSGTQEPEIDIRQLKAGIYFVEVMSRKNKVIGKKHIVIQ